jgi:hypothetical protein
MASRPTRAKQMQLFRAVTSAGACLHVTANNVRDVR